MFEAIPGYQEDNESDEEISIEFNKLRREGYKVQYNGSIPLPNKQIKEENNFKLYDLFFSCFQCFKWQRDGNQSEFKRLNNRNDS